MSNPGSVSFLPNLGNVAAIVIILESIGDEACFKVSDVFVDACCEGNKGKYFGT